MSQVVTAHITGTVWKVLVAVGDEVAADQVVAILESMKMEMPLESPVAGRVAEILAAPGQAVEEGDPVVRLE